MNCTKQPLKKFYAYVPNENGKEPLGTFNKLLFELKTLRGAVNRCSKIFKKSYRLYTYTNFYDEKTFTLILKERKDYD
jgi:hypothetical protein